MKNVTKLIILESTQECTDSLYNTIY